MLSVISDNKYLLAIHSFSSCHAQSGKCTLIVNALIEKLDVVKIVIVHLESDSTLI